MGFPVVSLTNPAYWVEIWGTVVEAERSQTNPGHYFPIEDLWCPILPDSRYLNVYVNCPSGPPHWHAGGWLDFGIQSLDLGGQQALTNVQDSKRLILREFNLVEVQAFGGPYRVVYSPPYWFPGVELYVWEYIGPVSDSTEDLLEAGFDSLHGAIAADRQATQDAIAAQNLTLDQIKQKTDTL